MTRKKCKDFEGPRVPAIGVGMPVARRPPPPTDPGVRYFRTGLFAMIRSRAARPVGRPEQIHCLDLSGLASRPARSLLPAPRRFHDPRSRYPITLQQTGEARPREAAPLAPPETRTGSPRPRVGQDPAIGTEPPPSHGESLASPLVAAFGARTTSGGRTPRKQLTAPLGSVEATSRASIRLHPVRADQNLQPAGVLATASALLAKERAPRSPKAARFASWVPETQASHRRNCHSSLAMVSSPLKKKRSC
jgi:hypothetical protein